MSLYTACHPERSILQLRSALCKIYVLGSFETPEKSPTRAVSCLFSLSLFQFINSLFSMPKAGVGNFKRIEANISSLRGVAVTSVICVIMFGKSKMSWDQHLQEMIEEFRGKDWIDLNWKRRWNKLLVFRLLIHGSQEYWSGSTWPILFIPVKFQICFTQLLAALWVQSLNSRAASRSKVGFIPLQGKLA